jgi:hypothetical protein
MREAESQERLPGVSQNRSSSSRFFTVMPHPEVRLPENRHLVRGPSSKTAHDFDFLHGHWIVGNRRLGEPLAGTAEWVRFDTVLTCRALSSGHGHIEETGSDDIGSYTTLRLLDLIGGQWSIHRALPTFGALRPPLTGGFTDGVGVFIGEDRWRGKPILVRHTWTLTRNRPRWEQSFSADGGETWDPNWVMELSRVDWPQ